MIKTLKLNPDNRTEHEIELDRARIFAWPLSIFKATPEKPLSICDKEPENEVYRDGFNLIS
jgi:hypothetical protein